MNIVIWGTGPKALEFAGLCDPAKVSVLAFVDEVARCTRVRHQDHGIAEVEGSPDGGVNAHVTHHAANHQLFYPQTLEVFM